MGWIFQHMGHLSHLGSRYPHLARVCLWYISRWIYFIICIQWHFQGPPIMELLYGKFPILFPNPTPIRIPKDMGSSYGKLTIKGSHVLGGPWKYPRCMVAGSGALHPTKIVTREWASSYPPRATGSSKDQRLLLGTSRGFGWTIRHFLKRCEKTSTILMFFFGNVGEKIHLVVNCTWNIHETQ